MIVILIVFSVIVGAMLVWLIWEIIELWEIDTIVKTTESIVDFFLDLWTWIIYRFGPTDIVISTVDDFEGRAYVEWCDLRTTCVWHVPTQQHLYVRTKDLEKVKLR